MGLSQINQLKSKITMMTKEISSRIIFILILVHIGITFLCLAFNLFATVYAISTIFIGLFIAIFSRKLSDIAYITAYIAGVEIFWRMTDANVFYEIGKYGISAILFIRILRIKKWKGAGQPILFFLLLCVSIPFTIFDSGINEKTRQMLSFNLSGPFSLAICVLFFRQIKLSQKELINISWFFCLGVIPIFTNAIYSTATTQEIVFTNESNFITSGGFGPNQVSAILGLGGTLAFVIIINSTKAFSKIIAAFLLFGFLVQSVLTFSRGGIYNAAICILLISLHMYKVKKGRIFSWTLVFALVLIAAYFVIPSLDEYTGGKFSARFSDTSSSGRDNIALADIKVWFDHPVFGVGPGIGLIESVQYSGVWASAHTEYTRMLAEHGLFGLISLILLIFIARDAYIKSPGWQSKIWVVVFLVWPLAEMLHAAMRVSAISYFFGLANAVWVVSSTGGFPLPRSTRMNLKKELVNVNVNQT